MAELGEAPHFLGIDLLVMIVLILRPQKAPFLYKANESQCTKQGCQRPKGADDEGFSVALLTAQGLMC